MGRRSQLLRDSFKYGVLGSITFTISLLVYYNDPKRVDTAPKFLRLSWFNDMDDSSSISSESKWESRQKKIDEYHQERLRMSQGRGKEHLYQIPTLGNKNNDKKTKEEEEVELMQKMLDAILKKEKGEEPEFDDIDGLQRKWFFDRFEPDQLQSAKEKLSEYLRKHRDDDYEDDDENDLEDITYGANEKKLSLSNVSSNSNNRWGWLRYIGFGRWSKSSE
jgi:hypothetical protein